MRRFLFLAAVSAVVAVIAEPTLASPQNCRDTASFSRWLNEFAQEAASQGISQSTIRAALNGLTYDPSVVRRDRAQGVFSQTFLQFSDRMVAKYRMDHGIQRLRQNASLFKRIEQNYGVPGPVLVAFWGLETDFGANIGKLPTISSLATMAFDCRRPELFRKQLYAALEIVEHGDLTPQQMIGPWAGELGQVQFLPERYVAYGVDFDGDGRRDLLHSVPDALASAANYLNHLGWQRGEPWLEEVRVPNSMPWQEADLSIQHPRSQWAKWGVRQRNGAPLPGDNVPASLVLPMGRTGPAFLAYRNFGIFLEWNQSLVYSLTVAYFAARLAGAPPVSRGSPVADLSMAQVRELQQKLARLGYDVGEIDGIVGEKTRQAVKSIQIKLGLPADSYPTPDLLARIR